MRYHGTTTGGVTGTWPRRKTTYRPVARPLSSAMNRATRIGAGTRRSCRPDSGRQTPLGGVDDATLGAPGTRAPVRVEHFALRG